MAAHILALVLWTGPGIFVYWLCMSPDSIALKLFVRFKVRSDMRLWQAQYRYRSVDDSAED